MATTSNSSSGTTAENKTTGPKTPSRRTGATKRSGSATSRRTSAASKRTSASTRSTAASGRSTRSTRTTSRPPRRTSSATQPTPRVAQVQQMAERAVLVPFGASLLAQENLVSTVRGLATKYRTRADVERELKRYERRGAAARNRFERQVRRTRTQFERELRQRRSTLERSVRHNRRRFEREVRSVRKDLGKQSGLVSARVEKLVSGAQELIGSAS